MTYNRRTFLDYATEDRWALFPINGTAHPNAWQNTKHGDYDRERLSRASGVGVVLDNSGLAVIDIDPQNGGTLEAVEEKFGTLPSTFTVSTPSGGIHLYFRLPAGVEPLTKIIGKLVEGVDFLCAGSYVAAPTTIRQGTERKPGGTYVVSNDVEPVELPASVLAPWVTYHAERSVVPAVNALAETHPSRYADVQRWHRENVEATAIAREGERDDVATRMIFASVSLSLGVPDDVLSIGDIERDFETLGTFDIKDLSGKLERALNSVQPRTFGERIIVDDKTRLDYTPSAEHLATPEQRTQAAQIDRLTDMLAGHVIYTPAGWHVWNGAFWEGVESIGWIIKEACKLAWLDLRLLSEPSKAHYEAVGHWNGAAFWASAEVALSKEPRLRRTMTQLDSHKHLLNVRNGTINLRTGALQPHSQDDLLTQIADVDYDPHAQFPRWDAFLSEIFPDVPQMPEYLQRFLGYAITGETSVHVYPVWAGVGRNGKSVLIDTVKAVLGPYVINVRTRALEQGGNAQETELARMRAARLAVLSETNAGMRVDEAELKRWTGDVTMIARELYGRSFEYERQFQIVQITNHEPRFMSQGVALWERVRLVKFARVFQAAEQDKGLPIVLQSDAARKAVLAWMVRGAVDFYREGCLITLPEIEEATGEYKDDQNLLDEFLKSGYVTVSPDERALATDLFVAYKAFCETQSVKDEAVRRNAFYALLIENGFRKVRTANARGFAGIKVNAYGGVGGAVRNDEVF